MDIRVFLLIGLVMITTAGSQLLSDRRNKKILKVPATAIQIIDINKANTDRLRLLPGIGEATASLIVKDRTANGPYANLEELQRVRGIGPSTIERLSYHARCK